MNQRKKAAQEKVNRKKKLSPRYGPNEQLCPSTATKATVFYSVCSLCRIIQEKGNKSGCCLTFKKHRFPVNHPATDITWLSPQVSFLHILQLATTELWALHFHEAALFSCFLR